MHFPTIPNYWRVRIRIVMLLTLLTTGFGLAAVERWRQDQAVRLWDRPTRVLTYLLNPIRERTHRVAENLFRIDQLWSAEDANRHLEHELSRLRLENQLLSEEKSRLNRLSGLGRWSGPPDLVFLTADVIGLIANEQNAALIINLGRADGVRPRDPVVALGGLVGVVQSVTARTARVQAITDPLSAVGAVDHGSRARGIVYGRGRTRPLDFTPENEIQPIEKDAVLITSGFENSVFPKGVVIGVIQGRKFNAYGIPYGVVKPAVSFEALEEVLLVIPRHRTSMDERNSTATLGRVSIRMPSLVGPPRSANASASGSAATLADDGLDSETLALFSEELVNEATPYSALPGVENVNPVTTESLIRFPEEDEGKGREETNSENAESVESGEVAP